MAAVRALAELAKEPVPEQVNIAYGQTRLTFGRNYIIPKPFDPRLIEVVPPAVAKAAMESGIAQEPIEDWEAYTEELAQRLNSDQKLVRLIHDRAKIDPKRIVFAEADQIDVLKAAQIVAEEGIAQPILLGNRQRIDALMKTLEFEGDIEIIDPKAEEENERRSRYAQHFWKAQQRKGRTLYDAERLMRERNYFASMMVEIGEADGMLSGYSRNYPSVVKPILETVGRAKGSTRIAATNLMITKRGPMFISDTSINVNPTAKELAKIAHMTSRTASYFGINPQVAMLSFSNFGSSNFDEAKKVSEAVAYLHRHYPDISVDGPIQSDFALNRKMLEERFPFSSLTGKKVNVLIFPNLDAANITYKLLKELNEALSIGPILMGLNKPIHILQLGASVDEIVNMTAVTVIDAQQRQQTPL